MNRSLTVAYYSDALTSGRRYGLSRYAWELFSELGKSHDTLELRPISAHAELSPTELVELTAQHGYVPLPWPRKIMAGLWSFAQRPLLDHWAPWADVVHCVELDYCVPTKKPLVVTVHDLGPLTHPEYFSHSHPWLLRRALNYAARHAAAVVCVSQTTAAAVEGCLKQPLGDRLHVIHEGVSAEFFQAPPPDAPKATAAFLSTDQPFFLWAGSLNPRKNLARVVAAFERIASQIPHHLVATGGIGWDAEEILGRISDSSVRQRIHLPGRVSDAELRALYRRATAFLYPSLMEGFGLPILEAMAAGCPVLTSNLSSMPEVAGDAAFLVDPRSDNEIAEAMLCLATDRVFADLLTHKGRARAENFHWETCAAAMAGIYQALSPAHGPVSASLTLPQPALATTK